MWLARIFGYTWLACYWVIAIWRFGDDMYSMLVTLTISSAMLGELVGVFSRRLKASSLTDVLCGVWNKRGFQLLLSKAIRTARRGGSRLSMLFLDLDDFKGVNDSLGHAEGDRVLRAFAVQIEAGSRTGDTLARIGGDEFVLLMPETGAEQGDAVARRLQEAVDVVSWSYGVAELLPGEGAEEFISRADQLMLEQKARRRAQRAGGGAADRLSP
jgi:diguanylate cyclase (GGDEF)-like protein